MKDAELSRKQLREDADLADMGRPLKFQYQENSNTKLLQLRSSNLKKLL